MKRIISVLLCLLLLTALFPAALAGGVSDVMIVVNCSEWVSLREKPDTASKRLAKVKLGEMVKYCVDAGGGFILCEYQKKTGYIQSKYLKTTAYSNDDTLLVNQIVVNCDEWVSLRQYANSSSARLMQVPVGTIVTGCIRVNDYVLCRVGNRQGYIAKEYLTAAAADITKQDAETVAKAAGKYAEITEPMQVVNCNEWVSMRITASDSAGRICKIPLGATVTNCVQVSDRFVYCQYNGLWGYILIQYLQQYPQEPQGTHLMDLPALPEAQELMAIGDPVLFQVLETGNIVIAQREQEETREVLLAACYDAQMNPLWAVGVISESEPGELWATDAFLGGTEYEPILVLYNAGEGFRAFKVGPWQDLLWECTDVTAQIIGGGLIHALDVDGTVYALGYYVGEMICLNTITGEHSWLSQLTDMTIYWPFDIEVGETKLRVLLDCVPEDDSLCYEMYVNKADGAILSLGLRSKD